MYLGNKKNQELYELDEPGQRLEWECVPLNGSRFSSCCFKLLLSILLTPSVGLRES